MKGVRPTWRTETDITEIHKAYLAMNELDVRLVKGRWLDAELLTVYCRLRILWQLASTKKLGYEPKMFQ